MAVTQIRGGVPEGLRVGDGSAHRDRPLFPVLQQRATAPESWLPDAGSDPPGGVTFMNGATKRKSAFLESGTLSPNPWDLTPLGRNVWCTVEGTRTEDRVREWECMTLDELGQDKRAAILAIAARHGVERVRVFGSFARGDGSLDSDVDLLIETGPRTPPWFPGGLLVELEEELGRRVDIAEESTCLLYTSDAADE